jgi:hypothetical protein
LALQHKPGLILLDVAMHALGRILCSAGFEGRCARLLAEGVARSGYDRRGVDDSYDLLSLREKSNRDIAAMLLSVRRALRRHRLRSRSWHT